MSKNTEKTVHSNYDELGNASHYKNDRIDTIKKIESIWGTEGLMVFCEINAFKYRARMGMKDDPETELKKIRWYETMAKHCFEKITEGKEVLGFSKTAEINPDDKFLRKLI